ncbi:hypothetical protein CAPTEDRAFT_221346 [Capitella teleta]|uniref:L-dopachrome isomerase n=1 Tax=Capitella teleta TaxID=283909 RepID=R7UNT5_CAPTE|nr:hypothetical protein CAPTEDRAFT_221346 [Capitella teleta]|eukprot:ELU07773.1 hypothetical protein CAPTEDRAFT_221346 [Capitella teleta]
MPQFIINTNVPKAEIPPNMMAEVSELVSKLVGKPETYVATHVLPDQLMTFGGTTGRCALCTLYCIGKIGQEENKRYTAALMEKINRELKIDVDRMYIYYVDQERANVGWNGTTFA